MVQESSQEPVFLKVDVSKLQSIVI